MNVHMNVYSKHVFRHKIKNNYINFRWMLPSKHIFILKEKNRDNMIFYTFIAHVFTIFYLKIKVYQITNKVLFCFFYIELFPYKNNNDDSTHEKLYIG